MYNRGYEGDLRNMKIQKEISNRANYDTDVQFYVSTLIEMGENPTYIADILGIQANTILRWHRTIIDENNGLALSGEDLSFYRDKNVLRPDARTKGEIVRRVLNGFITKEEAKDLIGAQNVNTITRWVNTYYRDYDIMRSLPPGSEYQPKPVYVFGLEEKNTLQAEIFQHDEIEGIHAARSRSEYMENR
jgi:transposase-like protein